MRKLVFLVLSLAFLFLGCQQRELERPLPYSGISVYFSPKGGCEKAVVGAIKSAEHSIDVAIYAFTNRRIASALIGASKKGVKVRIIMDRETARSRSSVLPLLLKEGIPVRLKRGSRGGLMHNKYAIVDGKVVLTGSFNWTRSAETRNDENLVIIRSEEVAERFERNFEKLWNLAGLSN